MDIYQSVPYICTGKLSFRLVAPEDTAGLLSVYSDPAAVALMNDDNCDFGFFVQSQERMAETIGYWRKHYEWRSFVRFTVIGTVTGAVLGTLEGFDGDVGVLRIDLASAFEQEWIIREILVFARHNFGRYFGNRQLVTKAIPEAQVRRRALAAAGWRETEPFRGQYPHYFAVETA